MEGGGFWSLRFEVGGFGVEEVGWLLIVMHAVVFMC
jgi:hypothetical protein